MKSLKDLVYDHIVEIDKEKNQLKEIRVKMAPKDLDDPLMWVVEMIFNNGYHDYIRVSKIWANGKSVPITHLTRLRVPAEEVPVGAVFYDAEGKGPLVRSLNGDNTLIWGYGVDEPGYEVFQPEELVECSIYLSDDGVYIGEKLMLGIESLKAAGYSPKKLTGGCKFDFFGLTRNLAGLDSTLYPEDEEQYRR